MAAWKEIDALRREIDRLEAKLAERSGKLPGHKEILPISHPVAEVNAFHGELVGFVADFSERFAAWRKSGSPLDDEGKAALMQALYLCGDGFMRVAQELDGR